MTLMIDNTSHTNTALISALLQTVSMGLLILDREERVVLWSAWLENTSGIPAKAALGQRLTELFPELTGTRLHSAIGVALCDSLSSVLSQSLNRSPFPLFTNDPSSNTRQRIPQKINVSALSHDRTNPHCLIEIFDVSSAVHREKILNEQKRFLNTILENEPECVMVLATDGDLVQINQAGLKLLEVASMDEARTAKFVSYIQPEDQDAYTQHFRQVLDGTRAIFEFRVHGKHGKQRWVETHSTPLHSENENKGINAVLAVMRDVTEHKHAEDKMRQSEARYRLLADYSHDVIWTADIRTRRFTYVSPSVERLRGFTPEEVMALPIENAMTPESMKKMNASVSEMMAKISAGERNNLTYVAEIEQPHRDGRIISTEVVTTWVLDEAGEPITVLGVTRDITERKKVEQKLELLARTDSLTGLANRRHFMEVAEQELSRTLRYGGELSALMLDIDHFKSVNDTYGHHTGDLVIQKLGNICRTTLRDVDCVGRIGGEEFAVILPQTGVTEAAEAAERLRVAVTTARVPLEKGLPLRFSISIGVATLREPCNLDTLLGSSDTALYTAKNSGRNRVCIYEPSDI